MTTRRLPHLAVSVLWVLGWAGICGSSSAGASATSPWGTILVPGGAPALQQAVRLAAPVDEWRTIPLVVEMSFAGPEGLRITRLVAQHAASLRKLHTARAVVPPDRSSDTEAPLPLGASWWAARFEPAPPPHDLLWAILASREMSSLYYGLLGLDDETLQAVQLDPAFTTVLVRHALVLPVAGPSLRISGGRVRPPGGATSVPLWEKLVGSPLDRPVEFTDQLLRADAGRLAHFYATLSALPPATVAFVLDAHGGDPEVRRERLRRLYDVFRNALGEWRADALSQPPAGGPADVLLALSGGPDGRGAGALWRDFWREAFERRDWPRSDVRVDARHVLDGAGLLEVICPRLCDPERLSTVAFLQRQFPAATVEQAPSLLPVARLRIRYPALALEIERMTAGTPEVFGELGGQAFRLERLREPHRTVSLVQFQAAVTLLARLRTVGAPAPLVRELAAGLAALPISRTGFDAGLARWLGERVFPAPATGDRDTAILRTLAGSPWQRPGPRLTWEGQVYRVDLAATEEARIRDALGKFQVNSLAQAIELARLADDAPRALTAGDGDEFIAAIDGSLARARDVGPVWWTGEPVTLWSKQAFHREIVTAVRRARPGDSRRRERVAGLLAAAADVLAADGLAALVYALTLHDLEHPYALRADLPRRHHLRSAVADRHLTAWTPASDTGIGEGTRRIAGSLLALDAGVPDLARRRITTARPAQEPNMAPHLATALRRTAALITPWRMTTAGIEAVASARARGDQIVGGWTNGGGGELFDRAGIAGARAGWLRWSRARGTPDADALRLEDAVRAGMTEPARLLASGAGVPPWPCICLNVPAVSWEARRQPRDPDTAMVTILEPALRVAVELHDRGVPAAVAPGVLAMLTSDLIEQSSLAHPLDLAGIAEAVRRVPSDRFDDYVAAVAARGVLVHLEAEGGGQR